MSYIRSGSNPEGLYIIGSSPSRVTIWHCVAPPLASKPLARDAGMSSQIDVPYGLFKAACVAWLNGAESFIRGDLSVREEYIYTDTGRPVEKRLTALDMFGSKRRPTRFMVRFQYKNLYFYMWRVTWDYIVTHNEFRFKPAKAPKKKRKP